MTSLQTGRPERSLLAWAAPDLPPPAAIRDPGLAGICAATFAHLAQFPGAAPPWSCCHLAVEGGEARGSGAFVAPPAAGRVEIAYFTLPAHEGRGLASMTAAGLVALARAACPGVTVEAKTLPAPSASGRILARLGFARAGEVRDAEIGTAWLWRLPPS